MLEEAQIHTVYLLQLMLGYPGTCCYLCEESLACDFLQVQMHLLSELQKCAPCQQKRNALAKIYFCTQCHRLGDTKISYEKSLRLRDID